MNPSDRVLRQYIAEALDPPRFEEVSEALAASPALRERLALLLATTVQSSPHRWLLPPPGVRAPAVLGGAAMRGAVMDGDEADWMELALQVPDDQLDHVVVVLELVDEWRVLAPVRVEEIVTAGALPSHPREAGHRRIDVTPAPDATRVAVALVEHAPDLTAPDPWADVRRRVAMGELLAVTFVVG
ncbi:MAG: hypothetical protein KTR31_41585 [Myxococcales bacterium]|nr:hypothetical protein [Myxococcales bacterium]